MPKTPYKQVELPPKQPDQCKRCPLLGLRPKEELERGKRESFCCLGYFADGGFPTISSKGIKSSAAAYKAKKQKLHRPCDDVWDMWMTLDGRRLSITRDAWLERRRPYELEMERRHYMDLFKQRRRKKKQTDGSI